MYSRLYLFSVHVRVSGNGGTLQRGWSLQGKKRGENILINIFLCSPKTIFRCCGNSFIYSMTKECIAPSYRGHRPKANVNYPRKNHTLSLNC
jgi:hypothetical protein